METAVEDVLQQHGNSCDIDLASRKAEEASLRRQEAAGWLRKMCGVVQGKDLPAQPSEEEFIFGLKSGIVLCNALNKVQPGAVSKVIEAPSDSGTIPDGAALSVYQYFENIRNFLVVVEELGIPTFEASDLEKGGNSSRILNCVLALKSYSDWKLAGGNGTWKFGGNSKPSSNVKQYVRKNTELFTKSYSRNPLLNEKSLDSLISDESPWEDSGHSDSRPLNTLVRELLLDKKQEDIPMIVENMLSKVMEEYEQRLACQKEQVRHMLSSPSAQTTLNGTAVLESVKSPVKVSPRNTNMEYKNTAALEGVEVQLNGQIGRQQMIIVQHQRTIHELKNILNAAKADMHFLQMKHQEEVGSLGKHLYGLANAASGYKKVLEENRKLYNQVQDLKGNIRVYCRVRPSMPGQSNGSSNIANLDDASITINTPTKNGKEVKKTFNFNKVFGPSATQAGVFADTQPLIRSVLDGYNVCIFAYGQTGSGKTFTMTGPDNLTEETMGVNYRALGDLFQISKERKDVVAYEVSVQMLEIYNEQVRDLLVTDGQLKKLDIRNNSQNGINVPDANLLPVSSTDDVMNLMNLGHKNRVVSSTAMNTRSSRSHSCLTVHVQGRDLTSGTVLRGCMHLVDLAGSERVDKSEVVGDSLKEATHINKSLSALGDVIAALAQKNAHVPYRNSKLTQLLQDALGGQAKTLMFVHISPDPAATGETISTLKFAERVSTVELGAARSNKDNSEVKDLKEQIANLKGSLATRMRSYDSSSVDDNESYEVMGNSATKPKRLSLDSNDMRTGSPIGSPGSVSDDLDAATSDSSEADFIYQQTSIPRIYSSPNDLGSKIKKPSPKVSKTPELRSFIPAPQPRRLSTGTPLQKTGRRPASVDARRPLSGDGKRKPGSVK